METQTECSVIGCDKACFASTHLFFESQGARNLVFLNGIEEFCTAAVKSIGTAFPKLNFHRRVPTFKNTQNNKIKKGQER